MQKAQLEHLFQWAVAQKDKKGRTLLERAREYLLEHPYADKYQTEIAILPETDGRGFNVIEWHCTCGHAKKKDTPICKHAIAKIILMERETLEASPKWKTFFEEYDRKISKLLEDFQWF